MGCTIVARNYTPYAHVLADGWRRHNEKLPLPADEHIKKSVVNLFVQDEPACRSATLAGCPECAPQHAFERQAKISIVHHDLAIRPPSSSETRFSVALATSEIFFPTPVEPVKLTRSTSG